MTRSPPRWASDASWNPTTFIAWGSGDGAGLGLTQPFDGKPMTVGNGVMVALAAKDKAQVDRIYKLALSLGGTDEGPPGPRGEADFMPPISGISTATSSTPS